MDICSFAGEIVVTQIVKVFIHLDFPQLLPSTPYRVVPICIFTHFPVVCQQRLFFCLTFEFLPTLLEKNWYFIVVSVCIFFLMGNIEHLYVQDLMVFTSV